VVAFGLWYWCLVFSFDFAFHQPRTRTDCLFRRQEPSLTEWLPLQCPTPSCNTTLGSRNIRSITAEEEQEGPSDGHVSGEASGSRLAETWRLDKYAVEFIDRDERYVVISVSIHIPLMSSLPCVPASVVAL
jgi:hypothetical protein